MDRDDSSTQNKNNKVVKYRRPFNINIGMFIFGIIFIYLIIVVYGYFTRSHIASYEVVEGSLSTTTIYKGVALRDEKLVMAGGSGYINYFAMENARIGTGKLIYSIDGSGRLADLLAKAELDTRLTSDDLKQLRNDCINFSAEFTPSHFEQIYTFKNSMVSMIAQLAGANTLENINNISDTTISNSVSMHYAPESGILEYYIDGYESIAPSEVNKELLDETVYNRKLLSNNMLLQEGDVCCKLCTSEDWSIVFPLEQEKAMELKDESYIKVKFLKNQAESWGSFQLLSNTDGYYGQLTFNNSMITFAGDRFVEIELIIDEQTGLKIPVSSIAEKEFYIVPSEYVFSSEDGSGKCVFKRIYSDSDGGLTWDKYNVSVYGEEDGNYYIGKDSLDGGDVLSKPDSSEEFTISNKGTLIGVYNINKGYADFREIVILQQNDDYAIVKSNSYYGLTEFDHIVLDAKTVNENDFL